jgi:acyl transferase domain-containing protein/acyl carrier protein
VSNVTGRPFGPGEAPDAGYWRRHLRQPVRFAAGLEALVAMGCDTFLEIGPGTDLLAIVRREELPVGGPLVPSLRAGRDDVATLLDAAGALYVAGAEIDWQVFGSRGGDRAPRRRDAPTYPFQRQRCWLDLPGLGRGGKAAPGQAATTPVTGEAAAGCLWQPVWEERAPQAAHAAPPSGPARGRAVWLLLADRGGFAGALGDRLTAIGERVVVAGPPGGPPGAEDFARWLKRCGGPCRVVHLRSLDLAGDDLSADGQERCCGSVLSLVRTAAARPGAVLGCWLVSRHAQAVLPGERLDGLPVAPLWGLGRTIALEHPELWSGIVDLDDASTAEAEALARLLVAGRGTDGSGESNGNGSDDQLALRAGRTFVPRLRRLSPAARPPQAPALTVPADSTCLITGGLGGIGLRLARWLAEHGARHLVLVSRRGLARPDGPPEPAAKAIEAIEALGTRVQVERGDVAVADDLARICASIEASAAPLWGVFHAAGVLQDGVLSGMSWERCARVLAPKVSGAWNLHRATAGRPLGAFVLFSSAASLLGAAGQGSYAAANAFLDALACHRRARGLPAVSVSWGPWEGEGMAASPSGGRRAPGLARLHADEALAVLARAIDGPLPHLAAMPADGAALAARATGREPALLADWLRALQTADGGAAAQQPPAAPPSMRQRLRGAPPHLRGGLLAEHLRGEVARVLGMPPAQLPERQGFSELGMDSLLAIELKNRLQTALEVALPATLALNHPSLESLMAAISPLLLAEPFAAGATAAEGGPSGYSSTGAAAATATATDLDALPDDLIAEMLGAELREAGY